MSHSELAKLSGINSSVIHHIESSHIQEVRKRTLKRVLENLKAGEPQLESLRRLVEGDIWFDSVESIEKAGFEAVYDIEVMPEGKEIQNFIGGYGGIILHNTFRPERIEHMAKALGMDVAKALEGIFAARAYNSDHQILLLQKAEEMVKKNNVRLLVIDSLTSTFRSDYTGRGTLADRQQKLNKHIHYLQRLADVYNLAVYVTNQVMARPDILFGDPTAPIGGHIVGHQATYRLYLRKSKGEKRIAKLIDSPHLPEGETVFRVCLDGVRDIDEKDADE
ncbi:MAG: DNA repair and recombination protein RadA [Candidatus Aenigmarchaeota archaeon]|nr:DNA repair and recombination protein RadA [Candidatus Aenigmarchaeota archaeon]